jgi:hypothetical protein
MGYRIYSPDYKYTAENYQIMNYGFGGSISLHLDSSNDISDNDISEIEIYERFVIKAIISGGGRLTTAMLYLSDVQSGGFTIFPKLGLFFKPESGSLLYWKLRRMDGSIDARSGWISAGRILIFCVQDASYGLSCALWRQVDWKQVDPLECSDG